MSRGWQKYTRKWRRRVRVELTNPLLAGTLVLKTRRATGPTPPPNGERRFLRRVPTEGSAAQQVQV